MHKRAPKINFRPWRAERKTEQTQQLLVAIGLVAALAVGIVLLINFGVSQMIAQQEARNDYVNTEIRRLDKDLREIKELKNQRAKMIERMRIIQGLQGNRPVIVRVFDEMVRVMPEGTFFTGLEVKDNSASVKGIADSNNKVSALMRNIDESDWFSSPNLTAINAAPDVGEYASSFVLSFVLELPEQDADEANKKPGANKKRR